jgi:hypothetical protein
MIDPEFQDVFKGLNLGIHEFGHMVFGPLGEFMAIAGGTILQCAAPVAGMGIFYRQRDFFAIAIAFGWLGTNFFDVAVYARDARAQILPLVSPGGGEVIHDWAYLLERLGVLQHDAVVASGFRAAGTISLLICLVFGGWLVGKMMRSAAPHK